MANWLHGEHARRDLPVICVDARQAHAVLSQMHNMCARAGLPKGK